MRLDVQWKPKPADEADIKEIVDDAHRMAASGMRSGVLWNLQGQPCGFWNVRGIIPIKPPELFPVGIDVGEVTGAC